MERSRFLERPAQPKAPRENPFAPPQDLAPSGPPSDLLQPPLAKPKEPNPFTGPAREKNPGFFPPGTIADGPAQTSEGPANTSVENALTLSSLSAAQTAAIAALPPGANAAFVTLWNALESSRQSKQSLLTLLDRGALSAEGEQPSAVEHLRDLAEKPRASGLDGPELAKQALNILDQPDETVYQGNRFTCAVANIERQIADQPAAFARLVEGLSSREGKATLPSGEMLERAEGSVAEDGSGRNDVDRLVQGALMNLASGKGRYIPEQDRFENDPDPGLKPMEIARVTAAVEGKDQVVVVHDGETHAEFERLVRTHGAHDSFQLGVSWNGADHMLLLQKVEGDVAHFFNPQTQSSDTMPVSQILFKSQMAIFENQQVDPTALPEDAQYPFVRSDENAA